MQLYKRLLLLLLMILSGMAAVAVCAWAADPPSVDTAQKQAVPVGQTGTGSIPTGRTPEDAISADEGIGAEIFGREGGKIHPFLIFQGVHTDNLFATNDRKKSDLVTTIAPGVWFALPGNREKLLAINTTTTSPGGLQLARIKPDATRRYQVYGLYSPEFIMYADNSRHDHINHKAEALFQYNFNSGLSFDIIDIFNDKEEVAGNGITDTLYQYQDNLFDFITTFTTRSEKFKIEFTYANYDLDYTDDEVAYRNRNDNALGLTLFYNYSPKTAFLAGTSYTDIAFDTVTIHDSIETGYYGGIRWDITARSRGTLKVGYLDKDFDDPAIDDQDGFSVALQTQHNFTPKRGLQVMGYRKFNESDLAGASSFQSTGIDIGLLQRFNEKWSATFSVLYEKNDYHEIDRDDDLFGFGPAIRFEPRKWLIFDAGYNYFNNDSNIDFFDYEVNQFFLRATASM